MQVEILFQDPVTEWGWKVGVYVALIGLSAGAYLVGYLADALGERSGDTAHGSVATWGYITGLAGVGVGGPLLLSHLATPIRAAMIPMTMTNFDSWMTRGSYFLGLFAVGAAIMFLWVAFGRERPHGKRAVTDGGTADAATANGFRGAAARVGLLDPIDRFADATRPSGGTRIAIGGLVAVFAAGVLLYSAMALGEGKTLRVPLWEKTFLIPVQTFTGLGAGLVTTVGLAAAAEGSVNATLRKYAQGGAALLVASLVALVATVLLLPGSREGAGAAVDNLLGAYGVYFIGVALVLGLVVPAILLLVGTVAGRNGSLSESATVSTYVVAAVLAVVGKVTLGLLYVYAATFTSLPVA